MTKDKDQLRKQPHYKKTRGVVGIELKEGIPTINLVCLLVVKDELQRGLNLRILRTLTQLLFAEPK